MMTGPPQWDDSSIAGPSSYTLDDLNYHPTPDPVIDPALQGEEREQQQPPTTTTDTALPPYTQTTIPSDPLDLPLPTNTHLYSVEYPGYVQPSSVPLAIQCLGGQRALDTAFTRPTATALETVLELNFRPGNPFAHPVPGNLVNTNNIVLKVVKRKKRRPDGGVVGEYTTEAVGVVHKTVRFRNMADFQYQPDREDPIVQLRLAMDAMDVDAIRRFVIPKERDDFGLNGADGGESSIMGDNTIPVGPALMGEQERDGDASNLESHEGRRSNLRLFPPPVFSRQGIPINYNFKANPSSMITTVINEQTGEEKKRLVNRMKWKGTGPATIMFSDPQVPTGPPKNAGDVRAQADPVLYEKLKQKFEERPCWTRQALLNQFTAGEAREIHNSKTLLTLICYVFQDGPWRDTLVRFSYDPRKYPEARFYQRLYFRNVNHPIERPSVVGRRQDGRPLVHERLLNGRPQTHIFDGQTKTKETAAFQLCDIHDPLIKNMIEDEDELRTECDERDGWYNSTALERIKVILRHKFFCLLDGYIPSEESCLKLLETLASAPRTINTSVASRMRPRPSKNNMAKGALGPEFAAAKRLKAKLDSNARQKRYADQE